MAMKIMLVVVVLVGCFAAVNCQSVAATLCVATGLQNNKNLVTCSTRLATAATDTTAFCALSCIGDLGALYDTCNFTPNPVSAFCPGATLSPRASGAASTVAVPLMVLTGIVVALASLF